MTQANEKEALELAMQAALAARRPTFLASLPRAFKLGVLLLVLVGISGAVFVSVHGGGADTVVMTADTHAVSEPPAVESHAEAKAEEAAEHVPAADVSTDLKAGLGLEAEAVPVMQGQRDYVENTAGKPLTEAQKLAVEHNDNLALPNQLSEAPDSMVTEQMGQALLPRIASDGRKPWRVYARPFDELDPRPRIALVMVDMGLSRIATDATLRRMPPNVTLVFDAQASDVKDWLARARHDGHETVLSVPTEPLDYPRSDPGPNTLLTTLPNSDNLSRFFVALKSGTGYVGITSLTGSRFTTDSTKLQPILEEVKSRGLLVLDTRASSHSLLKDMSEKMGIPFAVSARSVDENPSAYAIDAALAEIEQRARTEGSVVAIATPLPVTLERLEVWLQKIAKRDIAVAPLSAVVQ